MRTLTLALFGTLASLAYAQQLTRIDGAPQCTRCSLQLQKVASLGSASDAVLLSVRSQPARDSKGNFYVAPTSESGKMAVFDPAGRYARSIGKLGQGPGEFTAFSHHSIGAGDTLHIIDGSNKRYTKISPAGAPISSVPIAMSYTASVRVLPSGEIVGNGTPEANVQSIVVFSKDGLSKGRTATLPALDGVQTGDFSVVIPDSAAVWQAAGSRYLLEKWSLDGRRLKSITRSVPWFPEWGALGPNTFNGRIPMPTLFEGGFVDAAGRVWTFLTVPDRDFKPIGPGERMSAAIAGQLVDTYIEIIDAARGTVVVSQRFPEYLRAIPGTTSYVYSTRYNSDDIVVLDIYRLQLTGQ